MNGSVITEIDSGWVPPVDIVLEMDSSTSPAEIYTGTVWTQLKDCLIIAAGDTFKAGESGGQARVVLTSANLPAHTHSGKIEDASNHSHTTTSRRDNLGTADAKFDSSYASISGGLGGQVTVTTSSAGAHTHTGTIASTGGGQDFSILNPYYAVNIWQRIG